MGEDIDRPIKVLLVDDHAVVTDGLTRILNSYKGIKVVGVARTGAETLELVQGLNPDVVVLDIKLPDINGIEVTRRIRDKNRDVAILMLTMLFQRGVVCDALRNGASGYVVKDCETPELVEAIRRVAAGKFFMCHTATEVYKNSNEMASTMSKLTRREMDVLCCLKRGLDAQETADELGVAVNTVNNHRRSVIEKLGAKHIHHLMATIFEDDSSVLMPSI